MAVNRRKFWYTADGRREKWASCGIFGELVGHSRQTVWLWIRRGIIPGEEWAEKLWMVPTRRAMKAYREALRKGAVHKPRLPN